MINKSNQDFGRRIDGSIKKRINPSNEYKMVIEIELSFIQSQEDGARYMFRERKQLKEGTIARYNRIVSSLGPNAAILVSFYK